MLLSCFSKQCSLFRLCATNVTSDVVYEASLHTFPSIIVWLSIKVLSPKITLVFCNESILLWMQVISVFVISLLSVENLILIGCQYCGEDGEGFSTAWVSYSQLFWFNWLCCPVLKTFFITFKYRSNLVSVWSIKLCNIISAYCC